eukprot:1778952-Rhodomonas_salina.5
MNLILCGRMRTCVGVRDEVGPERVVLLLVLEHQVLASRDAPQPARRWTDVQCGSECVCERDEEWVNVSV